MKILIVVVALLALIGCGGAVATKQDATAELRPVVDKINAAWESMDAKKPEPFYAKEADNVYYDVAPLKYTGWPAYAEGVTKIWENMKSIRFTMGPDFRATRVGDIAWVTYTMKADVEQKYGPKLSLDARVTQIFEKQGDQWLVVHEHVSVPGPEPPPPPAEKPKKK